MFINRRNIIQFACGSLLAPPLLTACGGDADSGGTPEPEPGQEPVDDLTEIIETPGYTNLAHTPDGETFDAAQIFLDAPGQISAKVFLGDLPQPAVKVTFYNARLEEIHTGVTGEDGYLLTTIRPKRLMFAKAQTAHGELYGYSFVGEGEISQTININIFQTLAAHVANAFGFEYNIVNYLLQRHFQIGYNESIQSIDLDNRYFSQSKLADAYLVSQLPLDTYLANMAAAIIARKDEEYEPETQFQLSPSNGPLMRASARLAIDDQTKYQVIEFALDKAETFISSFVTFPYSSQIIKFFFSRIKSELKPEEPDPLAEVKQKLDTISHKIDDLLDYLKTKALKDEWAKFLDVWEKFGTERVAFNEAKSALSAQDSLSNAISLIQNQRSNILGMNKWFFGASGKAIDTTFLHSYSAWMQEKEFYTTDVQERINDYVCTFLLQQTHLIGFVTAMIVLDAQAKGETEEQAAARCAVYNESLDKTRQLVRQFMDSIPQLPQRVIIHKPTRTLWVGVCNSVSQATDFLKTGTHTSRFNIILSLPWSSTGTAAGVDKQKYMLKNAQNPNGVTQDVIDFADWRLPTPKEVENVFLQRSPDEKNNKKAIDVWAQSRHIPNSVPWTLFNATKRKREESFATIVTSYFNDNVSRLGYCFDSKFVRFSDFGTFSAGLPSKYSEFGFDSFPYFPVATKPPAELEVYYPLNVYKKFYEEYAVKLDI
ncbi:MAG: hypothetical protein RR720_15175 [Comamonas sp.]|uniref:hypothetical protein n=1 Tax=Comamonas sp. TaxID=34028 RepID=UPI002FC70113